MNRRLPTAALAALLALSAWGARSAPAHEMRPAFLQITETGPEVYDVVWKVPARDGDRRLSLHVRFAEDVETRTKPVGGMVGGAHVQRWQVGRPGGLAGSELHIDGLAATYTDTLVRVQLRDTGEQTALLKPERPSLTIAERPSGWSVAWTYFALGVEHILLGIDHLLFVFALLLLVRGSWMLVKTITAFTLAHSVTLALATLGVVHIPGPPVEAVIALSIVFVAAETLHAQGGRPGLTARWPWVVAFTFGLLHGFGFAGALGEIGLPGPAIPLALLTFNLGVEAGQLLFVAAVLAASALLRKIPVGVPPWWRRVPPYAIGGIAAFWTVERVAGFWS